MVMMEVKVIHTAIVHGNRIFWAGGYTTNHILSRNVEIFDVVTKTSTLTCMHAAKAGFHAAIRGQDVIFFTGYEASQHFDIYHTNTNTWSIGKLPFALGGAAIVTANNEIYVAGGYSNAGQLQSSIWKLFW
jgi:N-acetylneuraminic acid mutarotase